jgi:hypothetical protein
MKFERPNEEESIDTPFRHSDFVIPSLLDIRHSQTLAEIAKHPPSFSYGAAGE